MMQVTENDNLFLLLPNEIWVHVFSYFTTTEMVTGPGMANKFWRGFIKSFIMRIDLSRNASTDLAQRVNTISSSFANVEYLNLSRAGSVLTEDVVFPTSLTSLNLTAIRFHRKILTTLTSNLLMLSLRSTNFADPSVLPRSITKLDLSHTIVSNKSLIGLPPNLLDLNLAVTLVSSPALRHLPPNLLCLDLRETGIDDAAIPFLPTSLHTLSLSDTKITDTAIGNLPNFLRNLSLAYTNIGDDGIARLPRGLERLDLNRTRITNRAISFLPRELQWIKLARTKITPKALRNLPMSSLEYLHVRYTCFDLPESGKRGDELMPYKFTDKLAIENFVQRFK